MKYYLETNSLRQLSSKLGNNEFCDQCYTSILSISELLSGINSDYEFDLRKSIFRKLHMSQIKINLQYPEIRIMNAFGINCSFTESNKIIRVSHILEESNDLIDFQANLSDSRLDNCWEFLKKYDHNGNIEFKKSIKKRITENSDDTKQDINRFDNLWDDLNDINKNKHLNDAILYYAKQMLVPNKSKSLNDLLSSYDQTLNIFFLSTYYYSGDKISHRNEAGKNDFFDLAHLSYIFNSSQKIVTDDNMIHLIMEKLLFNKNICYVNDIK